MNMYLRSLVTIAFIFTAFVMSLSAQEPYTGNETFKVGDKVEATDLGEWKNAVIVGPLETNEFGSTYEIKFDGAKYSAGRINSKWVRPRSNISPARNDMPEKAPAKGVQTGTSVMYNGGGAQWFDGAEIVSYDEQKRQYRLSLKSGAVDIVPCHNVWKPGSAIDNSFFTGEWVVSVSAASSTVTRDGDLYRRYSSGMLLPPLQIKPDGTYSWRMDGKVTKGRWVPRDGVPGITILNGPDGKDWTVYESTEGYAPTAKTIDEIRFHHIPTGTGHYVAKRIGPDWSCVLKGRSF